MRFYIALGFAAFCSLAAAAPPVGLTAEGHDSRIDLVWDRHSNTDEDLFNVYRAEKPDGPWTRLNTQPHTIHVYSDFVGRNGQTFYYRVTHIDQPNMPFDELRDALGRCQPVEVQGNESSPSAVVSATTVAMNDEQLLDSIQKSCLRYFWEFGHPISGLAREGFLHNRQTVTTGGTGFGMITIMVGAERGFIPRAAAAERLLKMVTFLEDKAQRYHGIWSHHLRGDTGETIAFAGKEDNGGDIVESSFLLQGMLTVREYFDRDNPVENELRQRITRLWNEAEWDWYLKEPGNKMLLWHWSPEYEFKKNHRIGGFNECHITYLLAMASPTHAIPADCYYLGWAGDVNRYVCGKTFYGITQPLGRPMGGPLFFTHYSYLGLDPHKLDDAYTNYLESNRALSQIQHAYAVENPGKHKGYGKECWGLTSSQNPKGYKAHAPGPDRDDGTIAPTAALSAFPYTPDESMAALRHFYHDLGGQIWGPLGFYDAFNLDVNWVSPSFLAIDQGTIAPMIENHRTGLPWKMFMKSDVAGRIAEKLKEARPSAKMPVEK